MVISMMSTRARLALAGAVALTLAACGRSEQMTADARMPDTDIFLVETNGEAGDFRLGEPVNITRRPGYDNQPKFLPDGSGFLYTVFADDQADTYRYVIRDGRSVRVTASTSWEFSPTPMRDGRSFSTVRQESEQDAGGFARLWQFPMNGRSPRLILRDVTGLGYHTWVDEKTVALALGADDAGTPARLELVDVTGGARRVVATQVGRCLQVDPVSGDLAYLDKSADDVWTIRYLDLNTGEITRSVPARSRSEDFAISHDGAVIMGEGRRLYRLATPDSEWALIADWSTTLPGEITRISISPDGGYLAVVASTS
jgi:Tol biopolymer transport system component